MDVIEVNRYVVYTIVDVVVEGAIHLLAHAGLPPVMFWMLQDKRAFGEGVPSLIPPHGTLPLSQNLDLPLVIVIMYFQIKVRKRFIGDILHIVILDFSADIDFECKKCVSQFGPREIMVSLI